MLTIDGIRKRIEHLEASNGPGREGIFLRYRGDGGRVRPIDNQEVTYTEEYIRSYYSGVLIIGRPMSYAESLESGEGA